MNERTMLEIKCWQCQQTLVRFHDVFKLIEQWEQITGMLPIPLPPGCYGCMYQHLGIMLSRETAIERKSKDYEGFRVNDVDFTKG